MFMTHANKRQQCRLNPDQKQICGYKAIDLSSDDGFKIFGFDMKEEEQIEKRSNSRFLTNTLYYSIYKQKTTQKKISCPQSLIKLYAWSFEKRAYFGIEISNTLN
ncbi:hypothetical protein BpHYR1_029111 [Brachionus plicatilis]|uniref:Uncharacterized protein n=1 Tax=Brachionus plicatilis TaxID=10195 RepID=A0A3M7QU71_BRAPC|nr:hypothetical protein BpHYR1_029111 [Brachionus plicatilis]